MASQNFDIASLFERAFGYKQGLPFDSSKIVPPQYLETTPYENVPQTDESEFSKFRQMRLQLGGNVLGQPLFMPVGFDVDGELVLLPNEPTLQVSVKKIVVKTQLVGSKRDGMVKELISLDDYEIVLRGIAISTTSKKVFPEDDIYKIHELFLKNKSVSIISGLTALLGINKVVIESFDLPTMIGIQHAQAYELKMVSDADFQLEKD
jgi:hypothetical protein